MDGAPVSSGSFQRPLPPATAAATTAISAAALQAGSRKDDFQIALWSFGGLETAVP
jgi:hypothetical protein